MRVGRAAVYEAPNTPFVIKEYPVRPARAGEALVRVTMSTICRSDIHSYEGRRPNPVPGILGHERRPLPDGGTGVPRASLERAELNLETAVGIAPDHVQASHGLALAREKLGKKDQAKEAWTRVRDLAAGKPEHAKIVAEATEALSRLGR